MTETASFKVIKFKSAELPEQYKPMIFSKFLRSLRHGNQYFKLIEPKAYYEVYHAYLCTLLQRPTSTIKLAVLSDDDDVVIGWSLSEGSKLHYIWVNPDGRQKGIAKAMLFGQDVKSFTHITNITLQLWNSKFPEAKFNPFA